MCICSGTHTENRQRERGEERRGEEKRRKREKERVCERERERESKTDEARGKEGYKREKRKKERKTERDGEREGKSWLRVGNRECQACQIRGNLRLLCQTTWPLMGQQAGTTRHGTLIPGAE